MDEKVRDRRRAINRERGRRRIGWVVLAAAVLVAVGLFLWLRSSDIFAVKHITSTVTRHVSEESIAEATAEARGVSLLRLGLGGIRDELEQLPYVRKVELHRRFPNTLEILLTEYAPVACIQGDGQRWLVGDDGRVLQKAADTTLPLIVWESRLDVTAGGRLPQMLVAALPVAAAVEDPGLFSALPKVTKITVSSAGEVSLALEGSIEVYLGEPSELNQKLKVSGTIIDQYLRDGKQVRYVDARVPDRIAVNSE